MKKIVVIPLDERPCNYNFNHMLALGTDYQVVVPPMEIMGDKKEIGQVEKIWDFMKEEIKDAHGVIISIDTLLYSGIIPSRLHSYNETDLKAKLSQLQALKEINPDLTIYAFSLIMRNPSYSSNEEEPDYYADWGREIHRFGYINHKHEIGIATESELNELKSINERLPKEYLTDYLDRRAINLKVNQKVLELVKENLIDFAIIPQDDSSPYGLTAKDQKIVRQSIEDLEIGLKVYMYPGADEVANTLLARMINVDLNKRPLVYIKYTSIGSGSIIPLYEDRLLNETLKYHILAANGLVATSVYEADLILIVNAPPSHMIEASNANRRGIEYDAFRNLIEVVEYADYAIHTLHKPVVVGDVAYANGGDLQLVQLLSQKGLLFKLAGYAGWNTSSNTLGTCIPQGMIYLHYGERKEHLDFLALRYTEDVGYCSHVRGLVAKNHLSKMGFNSRQVDGQRGSVSQLVKSQLDLFNEKFIKDDQFSLKITDCYMPWRRMFEVGLKVEVVERIK
jgi:hypothetical protein